MRNVVFFGFFRTRRATRRRGGGAPQIPRRWPLSPTIKPHNTQKGKTRQAIHPKRKAFTAPYSRTYADAHKTRQHKRPRPRQTGADSGNRPPTLSVTGGQHTPHNRPTLQPIHTSPHIQPTNKKITGVHCTPVLYHPLNISRP